jgi:hypothetical protein
MTVQDLIVLVVLSSACQAAIIILVSSLAYHVGRYDGKRDDWNDHVKHEKEVAEQAAEWAAIWPDEFDAHPNEQPEYEEGAQKAGDSDTLEVSSGDFGIERHGGRVR